MKNLYLILVFTLILNACTNRKELELVSPNNQIKILISTEGKPFYSVDYKSSPIISKSNLGFELKDVPFTNNFKLLQAKKSSFDETWKPIWGQFDHYRNNYNQLKLEMEDSKGLLMNLYFRVFNDGFAFRYEFPEQKIDSILISNELTEFNFTNDDKAWWTMGHENTYERPYNNTLISKIDSANTPITIESANGTLFCVHEAALIDYSDMRLLRTAGNCLKSHLVAWPDNVLVRGTTPLKTPWRTIQIADNLNDLVASGMILNLNEPCKIENTSWIKPLKYIGIWWGMHIGYYTWTVGERHGANTKNAKAYIDFAAKHNIPAVLFEGWNAGWENWGKTNILDFVAPASDFNFDEVVEYANKKGVELIGHHETGGNIPFYEANIDKAFDQLNGYGINAVKTGYAGRIKPEGQDHHGQYMVRHYLNVVKKAAEKQIMVNAHEPIKPTGIERTYPNMMTREGARGMEYNGWSNKITPDHTTILPFTRILAGPMDYTPGIFNITYEGQKVRWHPKDTLAMTRVNTTLAKQMALWVVLYSPHQMAADLIENYEGHPAFQFFMDMPAEWHETRVLNGKIGDYATIARRNGDNWFIGSITDENPRDIDLKLDFLDEGTYDVTIYSDSEETDYDTNPTAYKIEKIVADANTSIKLKLIKSGGAALSIVKR